jgi:malonic semialdehyde reductase
MFQIKQPPHIILGKNSGQTFPFVDNSLIITSKGAKNRGWLDYLSIKNYQLFDNVEPNPSFESVKKIIDEFHNEQISNVIGVGGGSSLDVAKYVGFKLQKNKIMIPTTFGSGSEVTRISVLKVDGKKQSFHDDGLFADTAIVDSHFIENSPIEIIRNSAIDAVAQCSEGYDSKNGNPYTKFLCNHAFDLLEDGILSMNKEKIVLGSLISGLGFGNCSTTLGHALSYVFSNEGHSHGHALSFTTLHAHQFNDSKFYQRYSNIVKKLNFSKISLKQNYDEAADLILTDRRHLDNNPKQVSKQDIVSLLEKIQL